MPMIYIRVVNNQCIVTFKYNAEIVKLIKLVPSRVYNKDNKSWVFVKTFLPQFIESIEGVYKYTIDAPKPSTGEISPQEFEFKTPPYPHQIECFEYGRENNKFIIGDDMGLGKTKESIDIAVYRKQVMDYSHCLVICGVNNLKFNWESEIDIHSNEKCYILGTTFNKKGRRVIGGNKEKVADLIKFQKVNYLGERPYFLIINIEALRSADVLKQLLSCLRNGLINMIIFDEFHKVLNPNSKQGKALLKLKAECQIAMTGTPILNSPLELYTALNWLDVDGHTYYHYKYHYCIYDSMGNLAGFKNMDEMQQILSTCMIRRKKSDVLSLPPKIRTTEYLEMGDEQWGIYNEIHQNLMKNIDRILLMPNPLTELIRLRQSTGFTGILSSKVRVSCKYDRLMAIIEELDLNNEKVIVFSNWVGVLKPIFNVIEKEGYKPALIIGETKDKFNEMKRFQEDVNCRVILGTTAAMGTGFTLTGGATVVFMDEPWNMGTKEQAEDRAHRIGTKGTVNIITLICKDTIDERINKIVYQKGLLSDMVVDGNFPPNVNKKEILLELLG